MAGYDFCFRNGLLRSHESGMPTQRDIEVEFWTSPAVVPAPPLTKLLFQYLLNGPQTNYIGIYRFSVETCRQDTGLTAAEIEAGIEFGSRPQAHDGDPFLVFDQVTGLMWVLKRLAHTFPKSKPNEKQLKGIRKMLDQLPRCPLLKRACDRYRELGDAFASVADRIPDRGIDTPMHTPIDRGITAERNHVLACSEIPLSIPLSIPLPIGSSHSGIELENQLETKPGIGSGSGPLPPVPVPLSPKAQRSPSVVSPTGPASPDGVQPPAGSSDRSDKGGPEAAKAKDGSNPKALTVVLTPTQTARARKLDASIKALPRKVRDFQLWAFLQKCVSQGLPADEALKILHGMQERWDRIVDPWAYAAEVLRKEYRDYTIDLKLQLHERTKREPARIGQILADAQHKAEQPNPPTDEKPWG